MLSNIPVAKVLGSRYKHNDINIALAIIRVNALTQCNTYKYTFNDFIIFKKKHCSESLSVVVNVSF